MPVTFVYRSFDIAPTGKYIKHFPDDDTVLAWFRRHWDEISALDEEAADDRLTEILGCDGWFLWNPFVTDAGKPRTEKQLHQILRDKFEDHTLVTAPHCLQVFTEEDGEGGAIYYFDDHFLQKSAGLASYLLAGWELPSAVGPGGYEARVETIELTAGTGAGCTYLVPLERTSKYPLDDLGPAYRIEGVRLPDLAWHLQRLDGESYFRLEQLPALIFAGVERDDPMETAFLRAIQAEPAEAVHWAAWSDWRAERGLEPPGIELLRDALWRFARLTGPAQDNLPRGNLTRVGPKLLALEKKPANLRTKQHSLVHVEGHLLRACIDGSHDDEPHFGQWYFFDDLWASANTDLADAMLRFAARWGVLTAD